MDILDRRMNKVAVLILPLLDEVNGFFAVLEYFYILLVDLLSHQEFSFRKNYIF